MDITPIKTEEKYKEYLEYLESIFHMDLTEEESERVEIIEILIEDYEKKINLSIPNENVESNDKLFPTGLEYIFNLVKETSMLEGEVSLVTKGLKLSEEQGELSAEILKLVGYKFNKYEESNEKIMNNLLLEGTDCIIVVFDILSKLGFTVPQIIEMSEIQINKWLNQIKDEK
jgi:hypothetical protein